MTDLTQLTERDILIRLDSKFDMIVGRVEALEAATKTLSDWKVASEAMASGKGAVWKLLGGMPSLVWAVVATGGMLFAWFH